MSEYGDAMSYPIITPEFQEPSFVPNTNESTDFLAKAKNLVLEYTKQGMTEDEKKTLKFDVRIVWFCKVLENWKALVITTLKDGLYFEVTYNGNKKETYFDVYEKFENICIPD